jgi:hypothetical protein
MPSLNAIVPSNGPGVGCFDPALVLERLRAEYGDDLEFDSRDLLDGHYERVFERAAGIGLPEDSPVLKSAARLARMISPRYQFRLRVDSESFVNGDVDRYSLSVTFESDSEFPATAQVRFQRFLTRLVLGNVMILVRQAEQPTS